ncbi:MAG: hypothetical protein JO270_01255 [Acidobacteriaceae bacterium]|nr:hypothetical protein [Acidobacteriaceae bacterium]
MKRLTIVSGALAVLLAVTFAVAQQYPIMDKIANKVVMKYQQSSCEELMQKRANRAPPSPEEQRAIQLLRNDPQMRQAFINRIAAPIANKMFECGMIP